MQLKVFIIKLFLLIGFIVLLDLLVLNFCFEKEQYKFHLNINFVLYVFTLSTIIVCCISYYFYHKNFDIIGYVFLGITFTKMFILLFVGKPLMQQNNIIDLEKIHFMFLFFIFLLLETYMTIDLLNIKPPNSKPPNPQRGN